MANDLNEAGDEFLRRPRRAGSRRHVVLAVLTGLRALTAPSRGRPSAARATVRIAWLRVPRVFMAGTALRHTTA